MSGRQYQSAARAAALAGAGVTGLAALFVAAPVAHAAPTPASDNADPGAKHADGSSKKAQADVAPVYGQQKYRVGVRGKDGHYFPPKTTTVGTQFHVVETGPTGTVRRDFLCTSEENGSDDVNDATYCPGEDRLRPDSRRAPASVKEPTPGDAGLVYTAQAGSTVTVTQETVKDNLLIDSSTATLEPCEVTGNPLNNLCGTNDTEGSGYDDLPTSTDLVFVDPGIPPVAVDDKDSTEEGVPVTIDIKANDVPNTAPILGVTIVSDPQDGTATLLAPESPDPAPSSPATAMSRKAAGNRSLAAVSSYRAVYTPKDGFVGADSFKYTITTQNGTATATVRVTVTGATQSASASASASASSSSREPLAETGAQSGDLVGYAAALLAAGGGALALGRQRRRGRHAR